MMTLGGIDPSNGISCSHWIRDFVMHQSVMRLAIKRNVHPKPH